MNRPELDQAPPLTAPRMLSLLFIIYLLLLLYASMMPYNFSLDQLQLDEKLRTIFRDQPFGSHRVSRSDILSNLLLYVPLGWLLATRLTLRPGSSRLFGFVTATLFAALVSAAVETAQLFIPDRITSATDFLFNSISGAAGAMAGAICGRHLWQRLITFVRTQVVERPINLVLAAMLVLLVIDAFAPYQPTIDVGQVKRSLRAALNELQPAQFFGHHTWYDWLADRLATYAALAAVWGASVRSTSGRKWLHGAIGAVLLAGLLEFGKLFIVGRYPSLANFTFSAAGATFGMILGWALEGRLSAARKIALTLALLLAYLVWLQWRPFDFYFDLAAMAKKFPHGVEWLPLYHYAHRAKLDDVALFLRSVTLAAAVGVTLCLWSRFFARGARGAVIIKCAAAVGAIGLLLVLGQFAVSRLPSVTGLFNFVVGGALGALIYRAAMNLLNAAPPPAAAPRETAGADDHDIR